MMQYLQPMHLSFSTMTMPSSRFCVAPVGQTSMQDGSSHCMQSTGSAWRTVLG